MHVFLSSLKKTSLKCCPSI